MNLKQQEFVRQYFICNRNATEAYVQTYKCKRSVATKAASLLLTKIDIKEAIAEEERKLAAKFDLKKEDIIKQLLWVIDNAKTEMDGLTDRTSILKATDQLNKIFSHYAPEKIETKIQFDINLGNDEDTNNKG